MRKPFNTHAQNKSVENCVSNGKNSKVCSGHKTLLISSSTKVCVFLFIWLYIAGKKDSGLKGTQTGELETRVQAAARPARNSCIFSRPRLIIDVSSQQRDWLLFRGNSTNWTYPSKQRKLWCRNSIGWLYARFPGCRDRVRNGGFNGVWNAAVETRLHFSTRGSIVDRSKTG